MKAKCLQLSLQNLSFPEGGPGTMILMLGPSGIGKTTFIRESTSKLTVIHTEDVRLQMEERLLETQGYLPNEYDLGGIVQSAVAMLVWTEIEARRRAPSRRKLKFVLESTGMKKAGQARLIGIAQVWNLLGGDTQMMCIWPGTPGTKVWGSGGQEQLVYYGFKDYLKAWVDEASDQDKAMFALALWEDFMASGGRRNPWLEPWLNRQFYVGEGPFTLKPYIRYTDWYMHLNEESEDGSENAGVE